MPKEKTTTRKRARPHQARSIEATLWEAANKLRGSIDAAAYKHVVLGLIFLKYISDAFEAHREKLQSEPYAAPEDPDEYRPTTSSGCRPKRAGHTSEKTHASRTLPSL
jgi:type I restriction enzyme M protein